MNGSEYLDQMSEDEFVATQEAMADLEAWFEHEREMKAAETLNAAADMGFCAVCGCPLDGKQHYTCHEAQADEAEAA